MLVAVATVASPMPVGPAPLGASERVAALGLARFGFALERGRPAPAPTPLQKALRAFEPRVEHLEADARAVDDLVALEVEPLMDVLAERARDPRLVAEIAVALVREGRRSGIDPKFLLAVLLVENAPVDPEARSIVGAVGLMQVMPFHAGGWGCDGDDLTDPAVNICHGARILEHELRRSPDDVDRALLRYNGCVRGTNTPSCHLYPSRVRSLRASLEEGGSGAPAAGRGALVTDT